MWKVQFPSVAHRLPVAARIGSCKAPACLRVNFNGFALADIINPAELVTGFKELLQCPLKSPAVLDITRQASIDDESAAPPPHVKCPFYKPARSKSLREPCWESCRRPASRQ